MDTMQQVVLIGHTLIAVLIIALVLLQRGKGADAGAGLEALREPPARRGHRRHHDHQDDSDIHTCRSFDSEL